MDDLFRLQDEAWPEEIVGALNFILTNFSLKEHDISDNYQKLFKAWKQYKGLVKDGLEDRTGHG